MKFLNLEITVLRGSLLKTNKILSYFYSIVGTLLYKYAIWMPFLKMVLVSIRNRLFPYRRKSREVDNAGPSQIQNAKNEKYNMVNKRTIMMVETEVAK